MILMRRSLFDEDVQEMRRQLGGLLDAVPTPWPREIVGPDVEWQPPVEVFENAHEVVIKAALPDIDPKQVDITITNDAVTLKGSRKPEEQKDSIYHRRELRYGAFLRTVPLPTEVKGAEAKASYHDGMLEVRLPKSDRAKNTTVKVTVK
ncbi:MAG TPA: Hsp20/alpha crystallin family protein [bacterium]|nr:Hsp20/alpha crystallin family protein [bacterium]